MLDFLRQNKVDGFLFGGDQFDNTEISHHNAAKPLYKPVGSYKRHTEGFGQDILGPLEESLGTGTQRVWIVGNHDDWEHQLDETQPELSGCLDRISALQLCEKGWQVVQNGKAYKITRHLTAIHGDQLKGQMGYVSQRVAIRAVEIYGKSVVFGHTHTHATASQVNPIETRKKRIGWNLPAMCDLNPAYMRNRPSAWVNGFGIVEVRPDDTFNLYPIVVTDGVFSYGGKTYGK